MDGLNRKIFACAKCDRNRWIVSRSVDRGEVFMSCGHCGETVPMSLVIGLTARHVLRLAGDKPTKPAA